jgi:hypothetical protein
MLSFDDPRWAEMDGGYRTRFDPRPLLVKLESNIDVTGTWEELWNELHHQGDVGIASFAAIPHLVRIHCANPIDDWNTYAIVAIIELARQVGDNPDVPKWLSVDYFTAIKTLAEFGASQIMRARTAEDIRAILSILALYKGLRHHGKLLILYAEEELEDVMKQI